MNMDKLLRDTEEGINKIAIKQVQKPELKFWGKKSITEKMCDCLKIS